MARSRAVTDTRGRSRCSSSTSTGSSTSTTRSGHAIGDDLITRTAEILRSRVREGDVIARLGGDEFAVILSQTDREAAVATAEKLLEGIREEAVVVSADRTMR